MVISNVEESGLNKIDKKVDVNESDSFNQIKEIRKKLSEDYFNLEELNSFGKL